MLKIGKFNYLQIVQVMAHGAYLDAGQPHGKILLPKKYLPKGFAVDDWLDVFVYFDSEDRLIATTLKPFVEVGGFAHLKIVDVNRVGAFADWGLEKDLLIPFQEQIKKLETGRRYTVHVYRDKSTGRINGSTKIDKFLRPLNQGHYNAGDKVNILIWRKTELGYSAIIDNAYVGMLYNNEIFRPVKYGQQLTAYIKPLRDDDRLDLTLNQTAKQTYQELPERILEWLKQNHGSGNLTDKSSPEDIYATFAVSKSNYKKALGRLFKEKKIDISKDRILLLDQ